MAHIRKTNVGYRAEIELQGIRRGKSFSLRRDAVAWATNEEMAIRSGVTGSVDTKRTLRDTLERYRDEITSRNTGERWERIRIDAFLANPKWLPLDKKINHVTTEDFSRFRDERLKTVKPGTVLREFGIVSAVMEVARKEWKWIQTNPVKDVKKPPEPKGRDRLITKQEIKLMLRGFGYSPCKKVTTVTESMAVCFLLALRTGMRAGDLTGLTWANIHPQHATIEIDKVGRRKGTGRNVPLSKKSIRVLNKMKGFHADTVFNFKSQALDTRFRDIRERVGLTMRNDKGEILESTLHFHDTRHTAATWIVLSGRLTMLEMCNMMGWTDPKMALRYFNPKPSSIADKLD